MSGDDLRALAGELRSGARNVERQAPLIVKKAGSTLERLAIQSAPVDTGFHRSGIHSRGGGLSVTVAASAEYAVYLEWGTWKMAPQPILNQAEHTEAVAKQLEQALEQLGGNIL